MRHHPGFDWLEQYAAGSLSFGPALCVAVHVSLCPQCRQQVAAMQCVGGVLLGEMGYAQVDTHLLENILSRLDSEPEGAPATAVTTSIPALSDGDIPLPLRALVPQGYDHLRWSRALPSLRIAPLDVGDKRYQVSLHRVAAGGSVATHDHRGSELTLVLRGSFSDEDGVYQGGDFLVRTPSQAHRPIATQNGECICLSAAEAPVRFTGPLMRWLNPFVR
jgi:putative transcriptional regulator